ncbi:MAG: ATP-binding protein [Filifactor alocis]|nr:ATP-binding protein [Filifactor alocis]
MDRNIQLIYEKRRDAARKYSEERKKQIYRNHPHIEEIDRAIANEHIQIGRSRIMGIDTRPMEEELERLRSKRKIYLEYAKLNEEDFKIRYLCEHCSDTGYLLDKQGRYIPCNCLKELISKDIRKGSNMGSRIERENFESFKEEVFDDEKPIEVDGRTLTQRQVIRKIRKNMEVFSENLGKGEKSVVLWGNTGLGKSYMSCCVAKRAMDDCKTVIYFTVRELIHCLETYTFRREEYEKFYKHSTRNLIFESDLLIIDDLGTEMVNQFVEAELFHIINSRIEKQKQMLISTNKSPLELRELYKERIYSRMVKHFNFYRFVGEDIRRRI